MEIILYILYFINSFLAVWLSTGLTYKWKFMYKMRDKYPFLRRKPWSCRPCFSFWILLLMLIPYLFMSYWFILWNVLLSVATYFIIWVIDRHLMNNG